MLDQIDDNDIEQLVAQNKKVEEPQGREMHFLDHLEELRWHIIRSLIAVVVLSIVAFLNTDIVFGKLILGPSKLDFPTFKFLCQMSEYLNSDVLCIKEMPFILQSRKMTGQFTMHISSSIIVGFIISFPYVFWEIWRFISPGLYEKEQKHARGTVFIVSFLFFLGVAFGYFIICPLVVNFLGNYTLHMSIANEFDITSYVGTVTTLILVCGVMFQMPVLVYYLSKAGLLTPEIMIHFRKHAIIAIFFAGAILTPPDITSQVLIALPLYLLYQVSITVSRVVNKKSEKINAT